MSDHCCFSFLSFSICISVHLLQGYTFFWFVFNFTPNMSKCLCFSWFCKWLKIPALSLSSRQFMWASLCCRWLRVCLAIGTSLLPADWAEVSVRWASCCRDQVWKRVLALQPAVPAAAGSVQPDLLNLPHFNQSSCAALRLQRVIGSDPKAPGFLLLLLFSLLSAQKSVWSFFEPADVAASYKSRDGEKKKNHINQWAAFAKNNNKLETIALQNAAAAAASRRDTETAGWNIRWILIL